MKSCSPSTSGLRDSFSDAHIALVTAPTQQTQQCQEAGLPKHWMMES